MKHIPQENLLCEKLLEFNPLSVAKALFEPSKMRLEV